MMAILMMTSCSKPLSKSLSQKQLQEYINTLPDYPRRNTFNKKEQEDAAIEADLVCIVNSHDSGFMGMFSSSEEQQVINNDAQIPVLCVNAVATTIPDIP